MNYNDKKRIENKIRNLIFIQNRKSFILKCDIDNLNLNDEEKEYANKFIEKIGVRIVNYEITRNNRGDLVCDYDYGQVSGIDISHLDMPVKADLEYNDDGDLIYSDFTKLDECLDKEFIPHHVLKNENDGSYYINLRELIEHQFNEEEVKYIINYLNDKGIFVHGESSSLCGEFDNYIWYDNFKSNYSYDKVNFDDITNKFVEYKNNPTSELREEIILSNIGLVKFIALKISKTTDVSIEDLESYGFEGLIRAINNYDINSGIKFSTYAATCIRYAIIDGVGEFLGFGYGHFYNKYFLVKQSVEKEFDTYFDGDIKLTDIIIERMVKNGYIKSCTSDCYKSKLLMLHSLNLDDYLDYSVEYSEKNCFDDKCFDNDLIQDNYLDLELVNKNLSSIFNESFRCLSEKELEIINLAYGFNENKILNFREIGDIFGLSRERIRQIHNDAVNKIMKFNRKSDLREYIEEFDKYNYNPNTVVAYQKGKYK